MIQEYRMLTYNSCGVGLSVGSFIKHLAIISSRIDGKASLFGNFGAGSSTIWVSRSSIPCGPPGSSALSLPKGNLPIASSCKVKPTLHTSDLTVYGEPCIRSGAIYVPVPTKVSATDPSSSLETPKSQILIWPRELTSIFDGLISRCMMRCSLYRYVRPPRTASAIFPNTSTRIGPKFFDILSSDLKVENFVSYVNSTERYFIYLPYIHVLHTHNDVPCIIHKGAIKRDDIW